MDLEQKVLDLERELKSIRLVLGTMCITTGLTTLQTFKRHNPDIYEDVRDMVIGFNELQMHHMAEAPSIADYHKKPNADGSPRA